MKKEDEERVLKLSSIVQFRDGDYIIYSRTIHHDIVRPDMNGRLSLVQNM